MSSFSPMIFEHIGDSCFLTRRYAYMRSPETCWLRILGLPTTNETDSTHEEGFLFWKTDKLVHNVNDSVYESHMHEPTK